MIFLEIQIFYLSYYYYLLRRNNIFSANVELLLNRESLTPNLSGVSLKLSLRIILRVRLFIKYLQEKESFQGLLFKKEKYIIVRSVY